MYSGTIYPGNICIYLLCYILQDFPICPTWGFPYKSESNCKGGCPGQLTVFDLSFLAFSLGVSPSREGPVFSGFVVAPGQICINFSKFSLDLITSQKFIAKGSMSICLSASVAHNKKQFGSLYTNNDLWERQNRQECLILGTDVMTCSIYTIIFNS